MSKFHTSVGPITHGMNGSSRSAACGSRFCPKMASQRWMSARMPTGASQSPMSANRPNHPRWKTARLSASDSPMIIGAHRINSGTFAGSMVRIPM